MWVRVSLAGFCLAGLLSACAIIDPVDSRYDTVGRSLAKARDEAIFLNLVRASHDYPLSFTTVSNVTPSLTNVSQFALPTFIEGPLFKGATPIAPPYKDFLFTNNTASNSTSVSTNFSVSTQETSAFYEGFLKPIDLTTLDYFIRQGYPREMLFWLFTDYFEVTTNGHTLGYRYTPPDDYGCPPDDPHRRCFTDWVRLATLSGLTVEQRTLQKSSSGKSGGGSDTKSSSASESAKPSTTAFARFCFSTVLAQQARHAMPTALVDETFKKLGSDAVFNPTQKCGSPAWNPLSTLNKPQLDVFVFQVGATTFKIVPRSAYGVFEFLGNLMKMQRYQPGLDSTPIPAEPHRAARPEPDPGGAAGSHVPARSAERARRPISDNDRPRRRRELFLAYLVLRRRLLRAAERGDDQADLRLAGAAHRHPDRGLRSFDHAHRPHHSIAKSGRASPDFPVLGRARPAAILRLPRRAIGLRLGGKASLPAGEAAGTRS